MLVLRSAHFVHHRSGDLHRIQTALGRDVEFDARADEISFDADVADLPVVGYDPFLNELMLKDCEDAVASRVSDVTPFRTVVENAIAPLLPHAEAQAKTVARQLGLSERTFARRLATQGLSFGTIIDDLRRDLAARYLKRRELQISRIAWLLGFQQSSAFSHASRRWFGRSPLAYRQENLMRSP
jgi:AraC-like DNA-binding protein